MADLKNKVVLITGSSIGIGRETAYKFASEGCRVVVTHREHMKEAQEVVKKCLEFGAKDCISVKLDLKSDASIKAAVDKAVKAFGWIDILVNNAGVFVWKPFKKQTFADIENQVRTNLEGLMKMTLTCLPHLRDSVINISSGAGKEGYPDMSPYCGTKFGVRGFTQAMAQENRSLKFFSVNPGLTKTRMTNFKGDEPSEVAAIVLKTAKGEYNISSGSDVDVWKKL